MRIGFLKKYRVGTSLLVILVGTTAPSKMAVDRNPDPLTET